MSNRDISFELGIVVSKKEDTYKVFWRNGLSVIASFKKFEVGELITVFRFNNGRKIHGVEKLQ
jgi:hypothetical protein